jgi:ribokinase
VAALSRTGFAVRGRGNERKASSFVVLGSCIADTFMRVDRLPAVGETVLARSVSRALGGKGANQAVALRRLGEEVALVSSIGEDEAGRSFLDLFDLEGVDRRLVFCDSTWPTGMAVPMILPNGQNAIVAAPSAALALPVAAIDEAALLIGGSRAILIQLEVPLATVDRAIAAARAGGAPVFLNPAPVVPGAHELLSGADVLIPNQREAAALAGVSAETPTEAMAAARVLRSRGPEVVVVTLGEAGAIVSWAEEEVHVAPYPVQVVDTTGAGDAFCAGLATAYSRGLSWSEAVDFACACGALACRGEGAIPWLPTFLEVSTLRQRRSEHGR